MCDARLAHAARGFTRGRHARLDGVGSMEQAETPSLKSQVIAALKTCYDPEIPVNIYELGLIYELETNAEGEVHVKMTLTTPNCPVADRLPRDVEAKLRAIP